MKKIEQLNKIMYLSGSGILRSMSCHSGADSQAVRADQQKRYKPTVTTMGPSLTQEVLRYAPQ
eukprot:3334542-Amphidinium_carterae.1